MNSNAPCADPRWLAAYAHEKVRGSSLTQQPSSPITLKSGTKTSSNVMPQDTVERMPNICQSSSTVTPGALFGTSANNMRSAYGPSPSTATHTRRYLAIAETDVNALRAFNR